MKRIINGTEYNTVTAIKIALHRKQGADDRQVTHYRTRQGKDFYHLQNHELSEGHLENSIGQLPHSYWHEVYQSGRELGEGPAPAKVRAGDRRIRPKPNS